MRLPKGARKLQHQSHDSEEEETHKARISTNFPGAAAAATPRERERELWATVFRWRRKSAALLPLTRMQGVATSTALRFRNPAGQNDWARNAALRRSFSVNLGNNDSMVCGEKRAIRFRRRDQSKLAFLFGRCHFDRDGRVVPRRAGH